MFTCGFHSHNKYDSNVEESGLNSGDGNILSVFGVCNDEFLGQVAQQAKQEHDCESLARVYLGGGVLLGEWCSCHGQHRPRETEWAKKRIP
jgi:hypothetical protein